MNNYIVVLLGTSASGKSFIVNNILPELSDEFEIVKKCISRPARPDELDENGELKNKDIIPGCSPNEIEKLDYHYSVNRNGNIGHYGFSKSTIDNSLQQGKTPVINKCDEETFKKLHSDYPNQILTLFVDPCVLVSEQILQTMKSQGRTDEEIEERSEELDNQRWYEEYTPNYVAIFNPALGRFDDSMKKALYYYVCLQLISVFKAINEEHSENRKYWIRKT